jgi:hypothetical protein
MKRDRQKPISNGENVGYSSVRYNKLTQRKRRKIFRPLQRTDKAEMSDTPPSVITS